MEPYKTVVMDYLQADRAVFVNAECCIPIDESAGSERLPQRCASDAVAIDLRHGAVYLCETALDQKLPALVKKLSDWSRRWESIKAALQRDCKVPANWRVHVWLFVPRDSIEMMDAKLEQLRQTVGSKFKVRITALEDVQPWRISTWKRCEEEWETRGHHAVI